MGLKVDTVKKLSKAFEELAEDHIDEATIIKLGLKVMDTTAVSLCKDNNLPMIIFSMREAGNITRVVRGEKLGSLVTA